MVKTEKTVTISFQKAMAILASAILGSIVATAFTVGSILNSDHFTIINNARAVEELKQNCVNKQLYELQITNLEKQISEIDGNIKEIMNYLKSK